MPIDAAIPRAAVLVGELTPVLRAVALALAEAGFSVALNCRAATGEAARLADSITRLGVVGAALEAGEADVGPPDAAAAGRVLADAARAIGPLGVLILNTLSGGNATPDAAGGGFAGPVASAFAFMDGFARQVRGAPAAAIVSIVDQRTMPAEAAQIPLALTRAAIAELTPRFALALAPHIRVNAIALGSGLSSARQTPILSTRARPIGSAAVDPDPADFARAVVATLALSAMTGQTLTLGGNRHVQTAPPNLHDAARSR